MKDECGFTLIEIIIAITLTGIILIAVFMFLNLGFSSWDQAETRSKWQQQWRVFSSTFTNDVHNAFSSSLYKKNVFKGNYQSLTWLVLKDNAISKVSYFFSPEGNSITRIYTGNKNAKLTFFSDIKLNEAEFNYYDSKKKYWKDYWDFQDERVLPGAVRLNVSGEDIELPSPVVVNIYSGREFLF